MRWWPKRVDLGTYERPALIPLPSVDRVVDEGVLIATSAVRMTVKNQLIITAVRDHLDYDPETISRSARDRLVELARENEESADRLEEARADEDAAPDAAPGVDDDDPIDALSRQNHRRRPAIYRLLAAALRRQAEDPAAVAALVAKARLEAADEVGRESLRKVSARDFGSEPGYALERARRVRQLLEVDLAELMVVNPPHV